MKRLPVSDRRHRTALRAAALWIHPIATGLRSEAPDRAAALRAAARLCETLAGTATCRGAKDAILAIPTPEGADSDTWTSGLVGALVGVNLHAIRRGVDPYRDAATEAAVTS